MDPQPLGADVVFGPQSDGDAVASEVQLHQLLQPLEGGGGEAGDVVHAERQVGGVGGEAVRDSNQMPVGAVHDQFSAAIPRDVARQGLRIPRGPPDAAGEDQVEQEHEWARGRARCGRLGVGEAIAEKPL